MKYKEGASWETAPVETAYVRARGEWDNIFGSVASRERRWRRIAYALVALLLLQLAGLYYIVSQRSFTPYFFSINELGDVRYSPELGSLDHADMVLRKQLSDFVVSLRELSSDEAVTKKRWLSLYDMATKNGAKSLNSYYEERQPFTQLKTKLVRVDIESAFKVSDETWQVDWLETERHIASGMTRKKRMRGMFRVVEHVAQTKEALLANPLGAYVDDFSWQILEEIKK